MAESKHRQAFEEIAGKAEEEPGDSLKKPVLHGSVAEADLLSLGNETGAHAGIAERVFQNLYRENLVVDRENAELLSRVQTRRNRSGCELEIDDTLEDYREIKQEPEEVIHKMREVVESDAN